ncbi:MAG TPA: helicase-related protein [Candidatus Hydrogenedens sp.]|nr:helicase-related protein [Candidatus Hydrogenedens sp.]HOL20501.1 helicase-related protein [Candidatus Hydrogenedens sp.]HPP57695.1 helicase-related protein [Candidatus Hydrogenedens sp.]
MENILEKLKKGTVISDPFLPEPMKIDTCECIIGGYIQMTGVLIKSKKYKNLTLREDDLNKLTILPSCGTFSKPAQEVFLSLETIRYRYASLYDPLLAVHVSKVDPLPHQIDAVYNYVLKLLRIRFLIADDPGAGKTIMAGLIIKELKLRSLIKRILIVVPGHLKDQWKREMKDRFEEDFEIIDRSRFDEGYRVNIWEKYNQCITSIDFAKQNDVKQTLSSTNFDFIIVDEAHKLSAYRYGQKTEKSERYKLGEVLSNCTEHLLFLTATPHKGDADNFRLFLDLLEPGFFATNQMMIESIKAGNNPLFIRRIKEDLRDFDGRPLFTPRNVRTIPYDLGRESPAEKILYNDLSKYVEKQYKQLKDDEKKKNVAFALVILQRRFASSMYALLESLKRRKNRLKEYLNQPEPEKEEKREYITDIDEIEDLSEQERWKEEEKWETVSSSRNKEELEGEIKQIDNFILRAEEIIKGENEIKLKRLRESIEELSKNIEDPVKRKILIFTESRDTLEYLAGKIQQWGFRVNTIHGGMNLEERIDAENTFRNKTDILIATEAAGEGINLQFCNLMINYDIPWNPNRLEQRMGRIHRYGQSREVYVHNFVAIDTREGSVLNRILEKLEEIRSALGSDKVYDVIGEFIESKKVAEALTDAALNARDINEILEGTIPEINEEFISQVKENIFSDTLVTKHINFTSIKELSQKAKENRLIPEYTELYFKKVYSYLKGTMKKIGEKIYSIESVPYELRRIAEDEKFRKRFGLVQNKYKRVTFDKEVALRDSTVEFLSFGHPLFEAVQQWIENTLMDNLAEGAVFYDPDGKLDGYIIFYEGEIEDGTGATAGKRLFSFYTDGANIKPIPPSILWDLEQENQPISESSLSVEEIENKVLRTALQALEEYKNELLQERNRQAEIKKNYGVKSLEYFIDKLDEDLIKLEKRKDNGENVELVINNTKEKKRRYEHQKEELRKQIQKETSLSMETPRLLSVVRVMPYQKREGKKPIIVSEEIEAIGMHVAMEYERKQGRNPEDVSEQNLGFDIRSVKYDENGESIGIRYIEVKTRADKGDVIITQNEWLHAQRFKDDYYLYIVFNASTNPELKIVRNPADNMQPEEKVVRYIVRMEEIERSGKVE